jgi:hypothetical protein
MTSIDPLEYNKFKRYLRFLQMKQKVRNVLRTWPFVNRRREALGYHLVGDRRRTWKQRLGLLEQGSALRLKFLALVASVQTLIIVLAVSNRHPEMLLLIPTFCLYVAGLLAYRRYRLILGWDLASLNKKAYPDVDGL